MKVHIPFSDFKLSIQYWAPSYGESKTHWSLRFTARTVSHAPVPHNICVEFAIGADSLSELHTLFAQTLPMYVTLTAEEATDIMALFASNVRARAAQILADNRHDAAVYTAKRKQLRSEANALRHEVAGLGLDKFPQQAPSSQEPK